MWVKHRSERRSTSLAPPSAEELQDALSWLLIQFNIETIDVVNPQELSSELVKMTHMLSKEPYHKAGTDLDTFATHAPTMKASDDLYTQARDCWIGQLQHIPGVSFDAARSLAQHYPTPRSLWVAYQDQHMSEDEKRLLVADLLGQQRRIKISNVLYQLFTSENPEELLL
jgi:hypothetical protein